MISKEEMKLRRDKVIKNWEINKDKGRFITELAKECNVTPETYRKYLREVGFKSIEVYSDYQKKPAIDDKCEMFIYECGI